MKDPTMQERTLALINMPIIGNAFSDSDCWSLAHVIAADPSAPMEDRLAALAKMNELTGCDEPCTPQALREYLVLTDADECIRMEYWNEFEWCFQTR